MERDTIHRVNSGSRFVGIGISTYFKRTKLVNKFIEASGWLFYANFVLHGGMFSVRRPHVRRSSVRPPPRMSATVWFLLRLVGFARAHEMMHERQSLTLSDARDRRLVNAIVAPGVLGPFAFDKDESFASESHIGLSSLVVARKNHTRTCLSTATGSERISSRSHG